MGQEHEPETQSLAFKLVVYIGGLLIGVSSKMAELNKSNKFSFKLLLFHSTVAFACAWVVWGLLDHFGANDWAIWVSPIIGRFGDSIIFLLWDAFKALFKNVQKKMNSMRILYKFPSRTRPAKFFATIENIISLSRHDDYIILCTLDTDDLTMNNAAVIERLVSYGEKVKWIFGESKNKVDAINRDMEFSGAWDILCLQSDDMAFIKEGFDLDILVAFEDGYTGLVHFPDQKQKRLITYAIMHRKYYEQDSYIYCPEFENVYCDNYQQHIAQRRGQYRLVDKQILEHRHFIWGFGEKDDLLVKTEIQKATTGMLRLIKDYLPKTISVLSSTVLLF